jgi:hypothetical protein
LKTQRTPQPILILVHPYKANSRSKIKMDPGLRRDDVDEFLFLALEWPWPLDDQRGGMITAGPP